MPHRIIVVQATGTIPDTNQADPCLYVGTQSCKTLDEGIPAEILPPWMQAANPVPRFDLMPSTLFQTGKSAKRKRWKTTKKLIRMGHPVYGQEYGERLIYSLYVIELDPPPGHPDDSPVPLYVGHTSKTIEERFREHIEGGQTASGKATGRIRRLRPDLVLDQNPYYLREDAERAETRLGIRLQKRGHRIYGPQYMPRPS